MAFNVNKEILQGVVDFNVKVFLENPKAYSGFKGSKALETFTDPAVPGVLFTTEAAAATWFCESTTQGTMLSVAVALNDGCDPSADVTPDAIRAFAKDEKFVAAVAKLHGAKLVSTRVLKDELRAFLHKHGKELVDHVVAEFGEGVEVGQYQDEVIEFVLEHFAKSTYKLPTKGLSERSAKATIRLMLTFGAHSLGKMRLVDSNYDVPNYDVD